VNEENVQRAGARWRLLKGAVQLLVIAFFVVAILYFMRRYSADVSNLQHLSWKSIVTIGAWSIASYTTYAYAVYVVLIKLGLKNLGPLDWIKIYFVSRLVNLFLVQGGNLYRLIILKKRFNFSYTNSIGMTVFLIWINAIVALFISMMALATLRRNPELLGVSLTAWSLVLFIAAACVPMVAAGILRVIRVSTFHKTRVVQHFTCIAEFFAESARANRFFVKVTMLSATHYCLFVGVNYACFQAIGQPLEVPVVCVFTTAFVFTRYINVVPGNLGVSELVGGLISEQLGVGFGNGLIVTGIVRIVEIVIILLAAMIYGKFAIFDYLSSRQEPQ
jgi:uncharacterized membrane protein YbhN (UPF0104 family)